MRDLFIKWLGGYPDIDSAIEAIRYHDDSNKRRELLTLAVKRLFATVGPEDILRQVGGTWFYENHPLTKAEVQGLREEAKILEKLRLWKMIQADLKYHSQSKVWKESKDIMDITAGKLLAYYADIVNTRIKQMNPN